MDTSKEYERTDKVIKTLNKYSIEYFQRLKNLAQFDNVNLLTEDVKEVYTELYMVAVKKYKDLGGYYYERAYKEATGKEPINANIMDDWVHDYLEEYDPVAKYVFDHEVERKRGRFLEAFIGSQTKAQEVDEALKAWAKMTKQFAEDITWYSTIKGYIDAGVKYVIWKTEADNRVCNTCLGRHDKIYPIDKIPEKPHWSCRCWLIPYKGEPKGDKK